MQNIIQTIVRALETTTARRMRLSREHAQRQQAQRQQAQAQAQAQPRYHRDPYPFHR